MISQARGVAAGPDAPLLHDAERKMCDPRALDHPRALQLDRPPTQVLEQPDAVPEQDGHQVNVYLVEKAGPDALLHDARGAYGDVLLARGRSRLLYGALDAVRDERERRPLVDPFLRNGVGEDEGGYPQGGAATPPVGDVERPPPGHERPHPAVRLPEELGALGRDLEDHLGTGQPVLGVA